MERRILVVEDSRTQAERIRLLLEREGYRVELAANGREGLERVQSAPPDLIISDVVMPEMDGYAFCQAVKWVEATRRIPFVLLTERNTAADLIKGLERGADNFITKPFQDDYLLARVRRIFEHLALREQGHLEMDVTVRVGRRQIILSADKQQIFELLFATYEALDQVNDQLVEAQRSVEEHARELETKVQERTREVERLYAEAERRRRAAESLAHVGCLLSQSLDPEEVGQKIVESVHGLLGAQSSTLLRLEPESEEFRVLAMSGEVERLFSRNAVFPATTGAAGAAVRERQPVVTTDVVNDPRFTYSPEVRSRLEGTPHLAVLAIPLLSQDRVIGALSVAGLTGRVFDGEEIQLAQAFADQAAVALQNAGLYAETERRRRAAESLAEVGRLISQSLDPEEVGQQIADAVRRILGVHSPVLYRLEPESGDLVALTIGSELAPAFAREMRFSSGTGVCGLAVRERQPVVTANLLEDPRVLLTPEQRGRIERAPYRAVLSVPLLVQGGVIGALSVGDAEGRVFDREDVLVAQAFADQAALALQNAQLYQQAQQAYDELSRTQEQLVQSQKMEAVGRLAGGVAHDFNNLLTIIMGRTEFLLARLGPEHPLHREIDQIQKTARRATGLTRQLLAFSRKQVLRPKVLDLNALVSNIGTMLQRLIGEDIELVIVPDPDLGRLRADPGQIEQVIVNLAVNARDAMPQGGKLTIETANVNLDEAYARQHVGATPGPHVMLAVSDTGSGMDAETQAHIFEPFFTTKEQGKGTGLGLATVYGIVAQSGGNIWVYSEPGHGTTFKIYLPRVEGPAEAIEPAKTRAAAPQGSETVLLVEDEDALREMAREVLERSGYAVLEAPTVDEALLIGERHGGPIHLLLTDVVMPRMGGRELAQRLAPLRREMKVLYMSGYTDAAIVNHGVLGPGAAFLEKPFTPDDLAVRVREVLDE